MKRRILAAALTLCLTMSLVPTAAFAVGGKSFDDVNGHWGQASVERWAGYGVLNGDDFGNFNPDKQMTRAEFATMLANMMGYTAKANSSFGDVASDAWYADAILKLAAAGVMLGDNNGNANPNKPISRAEAAVMLCRAFNIQPSNAGLDFADSGDVADWAKGSMAALAEKGMMNGVGNNQLAPLANITRASVARLVDNMVSEYVTESKEITGTVDGIVLVVGNAEVTVKDATLNENLIVAPKAEGAEVTITGNTTASDVYVDAAASVKVDAQASAGEVQLSAPKAAAEVAGKADTVTTTAAATEATVTVAKDATVSKVEVAAPNTGLNVAGKVENVNVASTATGAEVKTESGATVSNVTTSANDVKVSGNGKVENVTANGGTADVTTPGTKVENKTDSADNVTAGGKPVPPSTGGTTTPTTPGGSGGSGGGTSYAYKVSIGSFTGGTVTASTTGTNTANQEVTLTVTPNAQNGATMPYILKSGSLKVMRGEAEVTVTDNKFTMDEEGTYTVTAEFVQPITSGELFIAKDQTTLDKMINDYGYPANDVTATSLASYPYLVLGLTHNKTDVTAAVAKQNVKLLANSTDITETFKTNCPNLWNNTTFNFGKYSTCYVNDKPSSDAHEKYDALKLEEATYTFTLSFEYMGAKYSFTSDKYTKPGVTASELVTVKFMDGTTEISSAQHTAKSAVAVPTLISTDTKYYTGVWKNGDTKATVSDGKYTIPESAQGGSTITLTAESIAVGAQELQTRPKGPATNYEDDFEYGTAYTAAGVTLGQKAADGSYTYTVNASTFLTYAAKNDNQLEQLAATPFEDGKTYYFYGAAIMAPEVSTGKAAASKMVIAGTVANLDSDAEGANSEYILTGNGANEHAFTIDGRSCILNYFGAVADKENDGTVYGFQPDGTFTRYVKWLDSKNNVIAVNKLVLNRVTTDIPEYDVTFEGTDTSIPKQTVKYGKTATAPTDPTKTGYTFDGWYTGTGDTATKFEFTTPITANTTLTAKWTAVEAGGSGSGGGTSQDQNKDETQNQAN